MPDTTTSAEVPESRAVPKKRTRLSLVWVIPIVAAVAGVWIAVTRILREGPKITIVFSSAEGLEANKTKIITTASTSARSPTIKFSDDHKHVIATAAMDPKTEDFLVKDTKFWVVRPRMSGVNITGLGTLISGDYIGVQIGESKESERDFVALESPPLYGRCSRPDFHAQDYGSGFARRRHADFFPAPAGRRGGVVRTRQGRQSR